MASERRGIGARPPGTAGPGAPRAGGPAAALRPASPRRASLRRAVLRGAAGLALAGAGAPMALAGPGPVRFRILRAGQVIGTHVVTLEPAPGGGRVARTAVDIAVRLAGIVVYRYTHRFTETWSAEGRLLAAASRLDRNGAASALEGRAEADGFVLTGPEGTTRLPAAVAPLTWWDPAIFRRPLLFAAGSGRALYRLNVERRGLPGGGFVLQVSGDDEGAATYDAEGRWAAHVLKGDDGSTVTYERIG